MSRLHFVRRDGTGYDYHIAWNLNAPPGAGLLRTADAGSPARRRPLVEARRRGRRDTVESKEWAPAERFRGAEGKLRELLQTHVASANAASRSL